MKLVELVASQPETGDYAADCRTGRELADTAISDVLRQAPCLLGAVAQRIGDGGRYGPVEIGFFHRIAERAASR